MPTPFSNITYVAIDEILSNHLESSKFGYFLTDADRRLLVEELVKFIETSRTLKARGDEFLNKQQQPSSSPSKRELKPPR